MNKIVAFILASVYLVFTSGFAVDTHYCMGKISSITIDKQVNNNCGSTCGEASSKGCCKDDVKVIKINDAHNVTASVTHSPLKILSSENLPNNRHNLFSTFASISMVANNPHAPPLITEEIYLRNNVFRI